MIKALTMGAAMAGISAATYFGLELLPPGTIPPPFGRTAPVASAPVPAPAPVVVAAVPAPAPVETPVAVAEPGPEPVAAVPAPAPAAPAAVETPAEPAEPAVAPATVRAAPAADVIKPWWPDPETLPANQLKLHYAGQVKGQHAIALLFSAPLKLETLQEHATVRSAGGEVVAATWALGNNPKLAVLDGLAPGRYTVVLNPQVADQQGFMLGTTLSGGVYVQEP
jgi:hypothetical protein